MTAILILELAVILFLSVAVVRYRLAWLRELEARKAIHRARILDNDQRSVDNQRWAERVEQARELAKLAEQPAEHVLNALAIIRAVPYPLSPQDIDAVAKRLERAIGEDGI